MNPKFKPMLAASLPPEKRKNLRFPMLMTPKLDGIRCIITDARNGPYTVTPVTRSMKDIPNRKMRALLSILPPYLDGEIVATGTFQNCQAAVMTQEGEFEFKYHVFDVIPDDVMMRAWEEHCGAEFTWIDRFPYYSYRMGVLEKMELPNWCVKLIPTPVNSLEELDAYEADCLARGYEGAIGRLFRSPYKFGRSTLREQYMVKFKQFVDDEATVIGCEEEMHNANEATINYFGHKERSSHRENMVGKCRLGALVVEHPAFGRFNIGSGFTAFDRELLWRHRESLPGRVVTFKYQPQGVKVAPRIPIFKAFRDARDLSVDRDQSSPGQIGLL